MHGTVRSSCRDTGARFSLRQAGLLIDAEEIACWIEERRQDFSPVLARRQHDVSTGGDHRLNDGSSVGDHDVRQDAGLGIRRPVKYPSTTDLAGRVVEGWTVGLTKPDVPAEHAFIEAGRLVDVTGGD